MSKIRLMMVDDHRIFMESLKMLIEQEGDIEVVAMHVSATAAMGDIPDLQPDVVLMDLSMPEMVGQDAAKAMLETSPDLAIVILTMERDKRNILSSIKAGAKGFLLKDAGVDDVIRAIQAASQGEAFIDPRVANHLITEFQHAWESPQAERANNLKPRDISILRLLAQGLSNKEIGEELGFSEKTVKNYLSLIFHKLSISDRTQAAIYAVQHGLTDGAPKLDKTKFTA